MVNKDPGVRVAPGGQQQQQLCPAALNSSSSSSSFYCSRAVVETLASCFDSSNPALHNLLPPCGGGGQQSGPIDVEDLASFCGFAAQPPPPPPPQPPQPQPPVIGSYVEEAAFAYCTDDRWLNCPATSYCPLYDSSQRPIESWHKLPCGQELVGYYTADDEALEEYLSNEKRKEKSRDAARCRRSRETDIFMELAAELPVARCEVANLDKASVMRLAIAYLKTRTLMDAVPKPLAKPEISPDMDELSLKALDGFVLVLDNNGDMAYLSPNVKDYLGIAQMDLMGQSVFDYSHPCDHDEIRESLSIKASDIAEDHQCNMFLRLKCTLTSKGRKVNLKSASYKVIHCTGRLITHPSVNNALGDSVNNENCNNKNNGADVSDNNNIGEDVQPENREPSVSLVIVASPVPHPSNIEVPLGKSTFLSKHNLNMKFTYADDKLAEFLGWESNDLMGQSVFEFHHALDNLSLDKSFKSLFSKGQCETLAYRFLNKRGGYAWVVTQATLIHCSRLQKPLSVVCVNYLISGVECEDEVYSVRQLEARESRLKHQQQPKRREEVAAVTAAPASYPRGPTPTAAVLPNPRKPLAVRVGNDHRSVRPRGNRADNNDKENSGVPLGQDRLAKAKVQIRESQAVAPPDPYQQVAACPDDSADRQVPKTATASFFAPRTEDMNTGYLMFSEDHSGLTLLKDEPEDLTHLAPTPGDVCVPLDEPPFLTDMIDEFILADNYCPLIAPDLSNEPPDNNNTASNSSSSPHSGSSTCGDAFSELERTILGGSGVSGETAALRSDDCSSSDGDPFIYRDSSSRCSLGTDLHSPTSSKSPESSGGCDSLGSPYGKSLTSYSKSETHLSDDEGLLSSINFNEMSCEDELETRAPYIPMCDQDETLQMLMFDDMVMWGPNSDSEKKSTSKLLADLADENSSLAQLLTSESSLKHGKVHENLVVNPAQVLGQINRKNNPTTQEITAERERSHKRVHSYSTKQAAPGSKRFKHNDGSSSSQLVANNANLSSLEKMLSDPVQSSQLLQQLVSQQQVVMPNNNNNNNNKSRNWQDQLVQDDAMQGSIQAMPTEKLSLSPLQINTNCMSEQMQVVPTTSTWSPELTANAVSPMELCSEGPTKDRLLAPSPVLLSAQQSPTTTTMVPNNNSFETLAYDDFLNATNILSEENDFLRALDAHLI